MCTLTLLFVCFCVCFAAKWTANIKGSFTCRGRPYNVGKYQMYSQSGNGARLIANSTSSNDGRVNIVGIAQSAKKPKISIKYYHGCGAPTMVSGDICLEMLRVHANKTHIFKGTSVKEAYDFGKIELDRKPYNSYTCLSTSDYNIILGNI